MDVRRRAPRSSLTTIVPPSSVEQSLQIALAPMLGPHLIEQVREAVRFIHGIGETADAVHQIDRLLVSGVFIALICAHTSRS